MTEQKIYVACLASYNAGKLDAPDGCVYVYRSL